MDPGAGDLQVRLLGPLEIVRAGRAVKLGGPRPQAVLAVLAIGSSLTRPPVFGLISMLTPANEQGATIGVAQGVGSLARILAPPFATGLLAVDPRIPYLICSGIAVLTAIMVVRNLCRDSAPATPDAAVNPAK